jgi:hypothetical protein
MGKVVNGIAVLLFGTRCILHGFVCGFPIKRPAGIAGTGLLEFDALLVWVLVFGFWLQDVAFSGVFYLQGIASLVSHVRRELAGRRAPSLDVLRSPSPT